MRPACRLASLSPQPQCYQTNHGLGPGRLGTGRLPTSFHWDWSCVRFLAGSQRGLATEGGPLSNSIGAAGGSLTTSSRAPPQLGPALTAMLANEISSHTHTFGVKTA